MPKPRRNGRESRRALKEMQKRSVVYAMKKLSVITPAQKGLVFDGINCKARIMAFTASGFAKTTC